MSKVQLNLLPQAKMATVRAQKTRSLITGAALLVSAVSVVIFLLVLFSVDVIQTRQLSSADKSIIDTTAKIKQIDNLDKILTIQNQLQTLVGLHQNKHLSSRAFAYLPQVSPVTIQVSRLGIELDTNILQIEGTAESAHAVNTFIDTLKFTNFTTPLQTTPKSAFPSVIENSFDVSQKNVSFSLTVRFDPILFSNAVLSSDQKPEIPQLTVPSLTTTRSVLNDPANAIFNGQNTGDDQ